MMLSRLILVGVVAVALVAADGEVVLHGIHYEPPRVAPDIRALDFNGQPWVFSRQPHPLAVVMFGYVNCTDVCPGNLIRMKRIQEALGSRRDQVLFAFVTVDPDYETPERMKEGLAYYHGEIIGVTGTSEQLAPAWAAWNIVRNKRAIDPALDPTGRGFAIDHTAQMFLVQSGNRLRCSYPAGTEVADIVSDLQVLLDQPEARSSPLPPAGDVVRYRIPPMAYTLEFARNPTVPTYVRLTAGGSVQWLNDDYMDHAIGDIYLSPGDRAWQQFSTPGDYYYLCTATPGEALRVAVLPSPAMASD